MPEASSGTRMADSKDQENTQIFQVEGGDNTSDAVTDGKSEQLKIDSQSGSSLSPTADDDSNIFQVVQYTGELSIGPSFANSHQDPVEEGGVPRNEGVMGLPVPNEDQFTGLNTFTKTVPDIASSFDRHGHVDREVSETDLQPHHEDALFFIDTNPDPDNTPSQTPQYNTVAAPPIGSSSPDSDEEDIVFVPRAYNQQKAIGPHVSSLHQRHGTTYLGQGSSKYQSYIEIVDDLNAQPLLDSAPQIQPSVEDATPNPQPPPVPVSLSNEEPSDSISRYVNEPAAPSRDEKVIKRQKKRANKNAKRLARRAAARGVPRDDSDIEWGSDGPPNLLGGEQDPSVNDLVGGGKGKESEAILRDYLEGVKLSQKADEDEDKYGDDDDMAALSEWANRINVRGKEVDLDENSDEEFNPPSILAKANKIYDGPEDRRDELGQDEKDDDELRELEALRDFANRVNALDEGQDLSEGEEITLVQSQAPKISLKLQEKRREQLEKLEHGDGDVVDEELMELEALQEFADRINGQGIEGGFSGDDMGEIEAQKIQSPPKARVKQVKFSSYNQEITHAQWEADEEKLALGKWALRVNTLGGDDYDDDDDEEMGVLLPSQLDNRRQPQSVECFEPDSEQDEEDAELDALDAWISRVNSRSQGPDLSDDELDTAYTSSKPKLKKQAFPKMKQRQISPTSQPSLNQQSKHMSPEKLSQPTELEDNEGWPISEAEATEDNPWSFDPKEAEEDNPWAAKDPKKEHNPWSGEVIYEERTSTQSTSRHPRPHTAYSADISSDVPQKQHDIVVCSTNEEWLTEQRDESEGGDWSNGKIASKVFDEVHSGEEDSDSDGTDSSGSSTSKWKYFEAKQEGDMFNGVNHWSDDDESEDDSDEGKGEISGESDGNSDSHYESEEDEEDMEVDDYDQTEWFINAMEVSDIHDVLLFVCSRASSRMPLAAKKSISVIPEPRCSMPSRRILTNSVRVSVFLP